MQTHVALPFKFPIKAGERYHEPLAHHDGMPLASIMEDSNGSKFFGIAVYADGWVWPMCIVPASEDDVKALEDENSPAGDVFYQVLTKSASYYLMEAGGEPRTEFFDAAVPEEFKPNIHV